MQTPPDFLTWLDQKLTERDWSDSRLAREAGIHQSVISRARIGIAPGLKTSTAIAKALGVSAEEVLVLAGRVPKRPDHNPAMEEMQNLFAGLSDEDQEEILQLARFKLEREKKRAGKK